MNGLRAIRRHRSVKVWLFDHALASRFGSVMSICRGCRLYADRHVVHGVNQCRPVGHVLGDASDVDFPVLRFYQSLGACGGGEDIFERDAARRHD
jgi:hypothetical protein